MNISSIGNKIICLQQLEIQYAYIYFQMQRDAILSIHLHSYKLISPNRSSANVYKNTILTLRLHNECFGLTQS